MFSRACLPSSEAAHTTTTVQHSWQTFLYPPCVNDVPANAAVAAAPALSPDVCRLCSGMYWDTGYPPPDLHQSGMASVAPPGTCVDPRATGSQYHGAPPAAWFLLLGGASAAGNQ